jgi:signal transduction histidine kinase
MMSTGISSILERLQLKPSAARAHAIKNCLSTITMMCTLIERRQAIASPRLWKSLSSASRRLQELLAEQLTSEVADLVATSLSTQDWCSVEDLLASAVEGLWARAESAEVSLAISCGGGELRCDEDSLTEALVNLTANAIEASPRGATVTVETRQTGAGDQVWIVKDSGAGLLLGQKAAPQIRPWTTKAGGWGLGFGLARIAIARQGGVIGIATEAGVGTTITIWLPREMRAPVEAAASDDLQSNRTGSA